MPHPEMSTAKVLGIGIASGAMANVAATNVNRGIAKHQYEKAMTYKRKLPSGKTVHVRKSPLHGVGASQKKKPQPVVVVNSGGANSGLY